MAVPMSPPPRDHAMATAELSLTPIAGVRTQNLDAAAIFWRKNQGILRSRLCHPCWSRAAWGIEGMLSPKHIFLPGSLLLTSSLRDFLFPSFPKWQGSFQAQTKQPHMGFVTGSSTACPGEVLPWLQGKKNSDPARRLSRWKCLIKDEKASGKFR